MARIYYSVLGVGIVAVGALTVGRFPIIGAFGMGIGALFAVLGTLAPASMCLSAAKVDEQFQTVMREEDRDGEI